MPPNENPGVALTWIKSATLLPETVNHKVLTT